jgi:hypothetical protein
LKKSASWEKAEVQAKVEDKIKSIRSSLNLDLDLSPSLVLRPCLGQGASKVKESVLADSGLEGEIVAGVGRVRSPAFLNSLLALLNPSVTCSSPACSTATIVFQHPASLL